MSGIISRNIQFQWFAAFILGADAAERLGKICLRQIIVGDYPQCIGFVIRILESRPDFHLPVTVNDPPEPVHTGRKPLKDVCSSPWVEQIIN